MKRGLIQPRTAILPLLSIGTNQVNVETEMNKRSTILVLLTLFQEVDLSPSYSCLLVG
jgi:hypothetical protein